MMSGYVTELQDEIYELRRERDTLRDLLQRAYVLIDKEHDDPMGVCSICSWKDDYNAALPKGE
jgi:hypothetical protein